MTTAPTTSVFAKIEQGIAAEAHKIEGEVATFWHNDLEPALVSLFKTVSHDVVMKLIPDALAFVAQAATGTGGLTPASMVTAVNALWAKAKTDVVGATLTDVNTAVGAAVAHIEMDAAQQPDALPPAAAAAAS